MIRLFLIAAIVLGAANIGRSQCISGICYPDHPAIYRMRVRMVRIIPRHIVVGSLVEAAEEPSCGTAEPVVQAQQPAVILVRQPLRRAVGRVLAIRPIRRLLLRPCSACRS